MPKIITPKDVTDVLLSETRSPMEKIAPMPMEPYMEMKIEEMEPKKILKKKSPSEGVSPEAMEKGLKMVAHMGKKKSESGTGKYQGSFRGVE